MAISRAITPADAIDRLLQMTADGSTGPLQEGVEFTLYGVEFDYISPLRMLLRHLEALGYVEITGERFDPSDKRRRHKSYRMKPGSLKELREKRRKVKEQK